MKLSHTIFLILLFYALSCSKDEDPIINPPVEDNRPPAAPSDPNPADGSTVTDFTELTLSWTANDPDDDELTYAVLLSLTPSDLGLEADNLSVDSLVMDILEPGRTYYWKVRARDSQGQQTESDIFQFDIDAKVYPGGVDLLTQKDVNEFGTQGYTHITGSLDMGGEESDITDLTPMSSLYHIGGSLYIERIPASSLQGFEGLVTVANGFTLVQNYNLRNFSGLQNLQSLGYFELFENQTLEDFTGLFNIGDLGSYFIISENPLLRDFSGLENLTTIKSVTVRDNPVLANLLGLDNIRVAENITLENNGNLISLAGLENLTFVETYFELNSNPMLSDIGALSSLQVIQGTLWIYESPSLVDLQGLNHVEFLGGLNLYDNASLISLQGLNNLSTCGSISVEHLDNLATLEALSNLKTVSGKFTLAGNPALISVEGLHNISQVENSLTIEDNLSLTDLNGLRSLRTVDGNFSINNNSALKDIGGLLELVQVAGNVRIISNSMTSLDGLENLSEISEDIFIEDNSKLMDFCALQKLIVNDGLQGGWNVTGNEFNPSLRDVGNGNCK